MKIAVISPYYKEDRVLLERCINSVSTQTMKCDHFLVSDGHPQEWLKNLPLRHIELGKSHNDYGNTPRGIGGQLAISEGYDAICFLDADNWLDPTHIEACFSSVFKNSSDYLNCDYVIARRRLCRPDLSIMALDEQQGHVDTNCFFFLPGAFYLIPYWNLMPKEFSNIGDRVFYQKILSSNLKYVVNESITVNYLNLWESTYQLLGEVPPLDAKPNVNGNLGFELFNKKTDVEKKIIERLLGLNVS